MTAEISEADAIAGARAARLAAAMIEEGVPVSSVVAAMLTSAIEIMRSGAGDDGMKLWLARTAGAIING